MTGSDITLYTLVIGIVVLIYILYNQRRVREVHRQLQPKLPLIFMIAGLVMLGNHFKSRPLTSNALISLAVSLLVLAIGMGAIRAYTVKLWSSDDAVLRQGSWLTIGLWIVTVALHFGLDRFGHTGESSLLLYYGITLAAQRWVVLSRARSCFPDIRDTADD